jgi:hypothetical protein
MSLCSGRPTRTSNFQFALLAFTLALCCLSSFAQQPKVLAPHKPVAPRLPDSPPPPNSLTPRYLRGGLWMTDAYTNSSVYLRNDLEISSLSVNPILYLSNGVKLSLPAVTLQPNGTAIININNALAAQGISPYATLSGYVELQYMWPWDPLCATVTSVDATHSVIFTYGLSSMAPASPGYKSGIHPVNTISGTQVLEGAWWKQEADVTGFVTLSNTTEQPLSAAVQVSDATANPLGRYTVTVSPHGTKRVELQELTSLANSFGGLRVTFNGFPDALIVNGSLEDLSKGYSASIPLGATPATSAKTVSLSYAELGLMAGAADPMMHFPAGTVFTPYSVLRNIGTQPAIVTPVIYWMAGGTARSARQSAFTLAPLQTETLDVLALMSHSGLQNFNGSLNLVLEVQGPQDSVLLSSGSVDQNYTYVFEVVPRAIKESGSKNLSYWSTASGDDTMITLWNPADEAQDFVFKFIFSGGHYLLPVHLEARATHVFNVSEVVEAQSPDNEGNVIPLTVHEGSAQISGTQAENEHILVAMDAGTYNVRKATCRYYCLTCNGATTFAMATVPFATGVGGSTQLTLQDTWNNGVKHDLTSSSAWSSSATSVATVNTGLVRGVAVGNVTINGVDDYDPWYGTSCGSPPQACPVDVGGGASGPGNVPPTISKDQQLWFFGLGNAPPSGFHLGAISATLTANGAGNGTYIWTITSGTTKATLENNSSTITKTNVNTVGISSTSYSTSANDVTVQLQFTPSGGSQMTAPAYSFSIDSPYKLILNGAPTTTGAAQGTFSCDIPTPNPNGTDGYQTLYRYSILSFFGVLISFQNMNETFSKQADIYIGNNWPAYLVQPAFTSTGNLTESICAVGPTLNPPTKPPHGGNVGIDYGSQVYFVGSPTEGSGVEVQSDTLTRYQDHGTITNITSPVRQ